MLNDSSSQRGDAVILTGLDTPTIRAVTSDAGDLPTARYRVAAIEEGAVSFVHVEDDYFVWVPHHSIQHVTIVAPIARMSMP